jgi:microcystin-dependent protein
VDNYCVLGQIMLTAGRISVGGMVADGRLLNIADYNSLFTLLGTTYGGDGKDTFALPDLTLAAPDGTTYSICVEGIWPAYGP